MFGWAGHASAVLPRFVSPRADNSGPWCGSIAVKDSPRRGKRMSRVVRLYLDTWVGPRTSLPGRRTALVTTTSLCRCCPITACLIFKYVSENEA